jgi:hypothetical protein
MSFNSTLASMQVMNQTIRDTNPFGGGVFLLDQLNQTVIMAQNTTDQTIVLSTQWSPDGVSAYITLGNTVSVAAGTTVVASQFDSTLTGLKILSGYLKVVATAGVAPTTGAMNVWLQGMSE